jgi:hypothetical protein
MTTTEAIPGMDEELIRIDRIRFKQELRRLLDEAEELARPEQLMLIREFKREAARRDSYDAWGARKFREAARVVRDMRVT